MTQFVGKYHRIFVREAIERLARAEALLSEKGEAALAPAALEFHAVKGAALTLSLSDWGSSALSAEGLARTAETVTPEMRERVVPRLIDIARKLREDIAASQVMRE